MDWLYALAMVFNDQYMLIVAIGAAIALLTVRKKEVLLLALLAVYFLTPVVKDFYAVERPCADNGGCPNSYGFPSTHAAAAFVFVAAGIGSAIILFFLPAAVLIAYTRLYLGVHTIDQVAGGVAFAFVVYFLVEWLWERLSERFGIKSLWQAIPRGVGA
ncbi:MAG: phosphatase PAP2 family protein [Candidatus Micrarchaeota archaeon]|nr:phosphatase PAP2 family protein [Candidatus Micrarchaeota archaeon]